MSAIASRSSETATAWPCTGIPSRGGLPSERGVMRGPWAECNTIDKSAALRLLNVPNPHMTGHIHGVLPAHVGMRVRLTVKLNSTHGLVQEQRATIVSFLFHDEDHARYQACAAGDIFRPRFQPAGVWLQVDDLVASPIAEEVLAWVCLLYTSPSPRDGLLSRMPSSA